MKTAISPSRQPKTESSRVDHATVFDKVRERDGPRRSVVYAGSFVVMGSDRTHLQASVCEGNPRCRRMSK
jgi:hypothetical protein